MTEDLQVDSYWVIKNKFMAGAYPGSFNDEIARQKLRSLLAAGINCYIDLTCPGDSHYPYTSLLKEEALDYQIPVEWINFPIADFGIPGVKQMKQILDTIDQHLENGKKVYVHCIGGIGRTGTTVGCYLVRHGLAGEDALSHLAILRKHTFNGMYPSPESDSQIEFVIKWQIGQ
ncbi:MAG: dual specificity protein phosphatase family protein [Anaerolineaceae bacterium]